MQAEVGVAVSRRRNREAFEICWRQNGTAIGVNDPGGQGRAVRQAVDFDRQGFGTIDVGKSGRDIQCDRSVLYSGRGFDLQACGRRVEIGRGDDKDQAVIVGGIVIVFRGVGFDFGQCGLHGDGGDDFRDGLRGHQKEKLRGYVAGRPCVARAAPVGADRTGLRECAVRASGVFRPFATATSCRDDRIEADRHEGACPRRLYLAYRLRCNANFEYARRVARICVRSGQIGIPIFLGWRIGRIAHLYVRVSQIGPLDDLRLRRQPGGLSGDTLAFDVLQIEQLD